MRILASAILISLALNISISGKAEAAEIINQNTQQISKNNDNNQNEDKNQAPKIKADGIVSVNDNFIAAIYFPHTSADLIAIGKYRPKNMSLLSSGSFIANASAYTAAADECGKSDGITASGKRVQANRTLACPRQYKFGTKIEIDGMGTYVCEDRGGAIKENHFDIYMQTKKEAFAFGRRNLIASVVE
ncbi:MAG: 3D domain-containing protein [Candidatus Moranbacteria bacterium]|nr:3D domain-containing protein [Candidatus Moranbacteria bacterium]